jgi:hypothetical protein
MKKLKVFTTLSSGVSFILLCRGLPRVVKLRACFDFFVAWCKLLTKRLKGLARTIYYQKFWVEIVRGKPYF